MTESIRASNAYESVDKSLRHAVSLHPQLSPVGNSSSSPRRHQGGFSRSQTYSEDVALAPSGWQAVNTNDKSSEKEFELKELTSANTSRGESTSLEVAVPDNRLHDPIARHGRANQTDRPSLAPGDQNELEEQRLPIYTKETDPFSLSSRLKSQAEIDAIKANTSRRRIRQPLETQIGSVGQCSTTTEPGRNTFGFLPMVAPGFIKDKIDDRRLQSFYEEQNRNIQRLLKLVADHRREARDVIGDNQLRYKIAVRGSFAANVMLAVLQTYAATSSGSLALFTTMAVSLCDPLSNIMLMLTNRAVDRVDPRHFPSGKARIETAGNIAFCFIMTAVSLIIIVQSIEELTQGNDGNVTKSFYLASIIAVAVAFCTKLALFIYCFALRQLFSQIRILWEDHRNDIMINGLGLLTSLGGSYLRWWIDPMGAIVLSSLIVFLWLKTAYSEFQLLIGVSADTEMLQLITYISMTHFPEEVKAIDTVRSYHSGPRLIVEVDIVMDANATLRHTHDTAEALQMKLESLPKVERAYVHVDYETDHRPEHSLKKEL